MLNSTNKSANNTANNSLSKTALALDDDYVVKYMANADKEANNDDDVVGDNFLEEDKSTEKQVSNTEPTPAQAFIVDDEENLFEDDDEDFGAEIEAFVASQQETTVSVVSGGKKEGGGSEEKHVEEEPEEEDAVKDKGVLEKALEKKESILIEDDEEQEVVTTTTTTTIVEKVDQVVETVDDEEDEAVDKVDQQLEVEGIEKLNEEEKEKREDEEDEKVKATINLENNEMNDEKEKEKEGDDKNLVQDKLYAHSDDDDYNEMQVEDTLMHEDVEPSVITATKPETSAGEVDEKEGEKRSSTNSRKRARSDSVTDYTKKSKATQKTPAKKSKSFSKKSHAAEKKAEEEEQQENNDNSEENTEEEEYEIEKIIAHRLYKGKVVKYEIKWKGYSDKDNTMEAANRMHDDVYELCRAYWDSQIDIARPANAPPPLSRKTTVDNQEKSLVKTEEDYDTDMKYDSDAQGDDEEKEMIVENPATKKTKLDTVHVPHYMIDKGFAFNKKWPNANTSWTMDMKKFHAIQLSPVDSKIKLAFIEWKNGEKTIHQLQECHKKCPEILINYYEERLRFV